MINKTFALGTYELNLQTSTEIKYILNNMNNICTYIDTAVNYNNDYLFKDYQNYKMISKMASCHNDLYEFFVTNHLKCLNRDKIDIMLIHSSRGDWRPVAKKIEADNRFIEKGVSNFNIKDLIEYKEFIGHFPTYNEIEINPYYIDFDTVKFCKENNIKIIAYAILGGKYHAMRNVAVFSLPYLIAFASKYADIVILRPDSMRHVEEFKDVVYNYDIDSDIIIDSNKYNKSIEPMIYDASILVKKYYLGYPTYHNCCGHNSKDIDLVEEELNENLPEFEMLGDYATYLRYKYRSNYNDSIYEYDFLVGDDGNYYVAYLYDNNNNLSKINEYGNVKLFKITKR